MRDPRIHNEIAEIVGFDYNSSKSTQKFTSPNLAHIGNYMGLDIEDLPKGRKQEKIAEESGFEYEHGYSSNARGFNRDELNQIVETLKQKREPAVTN